MPRSGGESDKISNHFEAVWSVDVLLDVHLGRFRAVTYEEIGEESIGVEFKLERGNGSLQYHSVKRQKTGGDWSLADLCRPSRKTGRSILADLFSKRLVSAATEVVFVSSTGANTLRELTERSRQYTTVSEFEDALTGKPLRDGFKEKILPICGGSAESALKNLRSLEVILRSHQDLIRTVERRIEEYFYRMDGADLLAEDLRRHLAEYILENLGVEITSERIREHLKLSGFGLRDWRNDGNVQDRIRRLNDRYKKTVQIELINSTYIRRDVSTQIAEVVECEESRGAILSAPGGYGKSCVLAQLVAHLDARNIPFMCIRMDELDLCSTAKRLGQQLDLPASPAVVLAGTANTKPCVLVIDQLDAMSLVSGRNPQLWSAFEEVCEDAAAFPNMKVVLGCRDFDLNHDYRLRKLGNPKSGLKHLAVEKLSREEILSAVVADGSDGASLTSRQIEILAVPLHLMLYLNGAPSAAFATIGQLYDRYWTRKAENLRLRLGRSVKWTTVLETLANKMSESQLLFAPKAVVDDWYDDVQALISEHVLELDERRGQLRFFHESFFDYIYARRFCARAQKIVDFLNSTEQHLFRRAQVRQILAYLRDHDFDRYLREIYEILTSPTVRFHLKRMVASELSRLDKPTVEEWQIIEPYLLDGELSQYASVALSHHSGWFDLLDSIGVWERWLASGEIKYIHASTWYLNSQGLQNVRSGRIAELLTPYANRGKEWHERIIRVMSWGKVHKSEEMMQLHLQLIRGGAYTDHDDRVAGSDFWHQYHDTITESPKSFIEIAAAWFIHAMEVHDDGKRQGSLRNCDQNRSHHGAQLLGQAAAQEPEYFVEVMLPLVTDAIVNGGYCLGSSVLNRVWPRQSHRLDPYNVDDAILLHLRNSMQWLALHSPEKLSISAADIKSFPHESFGYLLLSAWASNGKAYADECADYIVAEKSRFAIGYCGVLGGEEGTGELAVSRIALRAITPHCSSSKLQRIEETLRGYVSDWEMHSPRWRGHDELLLLRSLSPDRSSHGTKMRIEELERKFPDLSDAIVPERASDVLTAIDSPISAEVAAKMTDDQWISAMQKYDGSTDRFRGGPHELSSVVTKYARNDRQRFAKLLAKMPDSLNPIYFGAVLNGISSRFGGLSADEKEADDRNLSETTSELFTEAIERLHALPGRPCGSAICGCVEKIASRKLPAQLCSIVSYYANEDPDPDADIWKEKGYYGGDPYDHGINCVRGQGARAIASLLFADERRFDELLPALEELADDPVISVRSCAITAYIAVLNINPDAAVRMFLTACEDNEDLCATHAFDSFVHYATATHYEQLRPLLRFALRAENEKCNKNAARQIVVAALDGVDVKSDLESVLTGKEAMRRAAVSVYARNAAKAEIGAHCVEQLRRFLSDESAEVRLRIIDVFHRIKDRLNDHRDFIAEYVESLAFGEGAYHLLHALEETNLQLPNVVCRAAERVLDFVGVEGGHVARQEAMVARSISTLIVRQYEQATDATLKSRCLDLIDRMERVGYYGIGDELSKLDR